MNIRQAILAAADHIERNPGEFRFSECSIPHACGTPGCALGWIGFFLGRRCLVGSIATLMGVPPTEAGNAETVFYQRMSGLTERCWLVSAAACAESLRIYADKYHPAEQIRYPDWNAMATGYVPGEASHAR